MPASATIGMGEGESLGPSRTRIRHVPGEAGLWVLLFGDMTIFTVIFTVYLHDRGKNVELFAASQEHLNRSLGAVNTLILLASSILVVFATRALRNGHLRHLAPRLTVAAIGVGACFVVSKAIEYHEKVAVGITPVTNNFYMWYYVITGLHLVHVVLGLVLLTVLSRLARKRESPSGHFVFFEGGACFWHMVDLLWIVIFPLLYLVR
jgi:nitric oxide reductase NorE protein